MDAEAQSELVRTFMVSIAPKLVVHSLESGAEPAEAANLVLVCAMGLASRYRELHETLTAAPQNRAESNQLKASISTAPVHKAQARVSLDPYDVPDLPRGHGH